MRIIELFLEHQFLSSLPERAALRYGIMQADLQHLNRVLPIPSVYRALDAGSGSGACSLAMKTVFHTAVDAIDNGSTQQAFEEYQRQTNIPGVNFFPHSFTEWETQAAHKYNLILLSQYCLSEECLSAYPESDVDNLIALRNLLAPHGLLLIGYMFEESPAFHLIQTIINRTNIFPSPRYASQTLNSPALHHQWLIVQKNGHAELDPALDSCRVGPCKSVQQSHRQ